jgi:predicted small secreted protein
MKKYIRIVVGAAVAAFIVSVAACNTTKGLGTDIEKAGEGLKESADRNGAK